MEIRRCAIVINKGRRRGKDYPVNVVNAYVTAEPSDIAELGANSIKRLYAILRGYKITSSFLPHVDNLSPLQRVHLAIFDCQRLVEGDDQAKDVIVFIQGQSAALRGLAAQLTKGEGVSKRQQAFIDSITSAGGNDAYWA